MDDERVEAEPLLGVPRSSKSKVANRRCRGDRRARTRRFPDCRPAVCEELEHESSLTAAAEVVEELELESSLTAVAEVS